MNCLGAGSSSPSVQDANPALPLRMRARCADVTMNSALAWSYFLEVGWKSGLSALPASSHPCAFWPPRTSEGYSAGIPGVQENRSFGSRGVVRRSAAPSQLQVCGVSVA